MIDKSKVFVDLAKDIYVSGMQDYESICEEYLAGITKPLGEEGDKLADFVMKILDLAQAEFERCLKAEKERQ